MRRPTITAMWPIAASDYIRCPRCGVVVPDTRMSDGERARRKLNGHRSPCDGCSPLVTLADPRLGFVWDDRDG